jgi:integrase
MLTDAAVRKAKPQAKRIEIHDAGGLYLVLQPSGKRSWAYRYRVEGKGKKLTLGSYPAINLPEARKKAADAAISVGRGNDPIVERKRQAGSVLNAVLDEFVRQHVSGLRSATAVAQALDRHVRPSLGNKSIYDLRRSDIAALLTGISETSGPVAADRVLAYISKCFNWQALRDDAFVNPVVRGMAKTKPFERARRRVLDDDEIRKLWSVLEKTGGETERYVKALFLTACRRSEIADVRPREIAGDLLIIPASRYKNKREHVVPLVGNVKQMIGEGFGSSSNFSKIKRRIDAKLSIPHWTFHDLRRTARSLMSRARVDADIAERCLGHTIQGVRGIYDRHSFLEEKRAAFEKLAALVETIVNPQDNVVALRG